MLLWERQPSLPPIQLLKVPLAKYQLYARVYQMNSLLSACNVLPLSLASHAFLQCVGSLLAMLSQEPAGWANKKLWSCEVVELKSFVVVIVLIVVGNFSSKRGERYINVQHKYKYQDLDWIDRIGSANSVHSLFFSYYSKARKVSTIVKTV